MWKKLPCSFRAAFLFCQYAVVRLLDYEDILFVTRICVDINKHAFVVYARTQELISQLFTAAVRRYKCRAALYNFKPRAYFFLRLCSRQFCLKVPVMVIHYISGGLKTGYFAVVERNANFYEVRVARAHRPGHKHSLSGRCYLQWHSSFPSCFLCRASRENPALF